MNTIKESDRAWVHHWRAHFLKVSVMIARTMTMIIKCICFGMKELNTFLKHVYVVAGQISRFGFNLSSDRLYVPNFFL